MAQVTFTINELRGRDEGLAEQLESEIRGAASQFEPSDGSLHCRILVEPGVDAAASRIRIQFERPGWVKTFGLSMNAPADDVRRATRRILGGR
jgi:hypothetical protein